MSAEQCYLRRIWMAENFFQLTQIYKAFKRKIDLRNLAYTLCEISSRSDTGPLIFISIGSLFCKYHLVLTLP